MVRPPEQIEVPVNHPIKAPVGMRTAAVSACRCRNPLPGGGLLFFTALRLITLLEKGREMPDCLCSVRN